MKVAVAGGTGFIGRAVVQALLDRGHEVWVISRASGPAAAAAPGFHRVTWSELESDPARLEGVDAIVNLAGETISRLWTGTARARILQSRLEATERVRKAVAALSSKPSVVVNASAVGIYGTSEQETFDEHSRTAVSDFLSSVVSHWEAAAERIDVPRIVKLRIGLVLGRSGGAMPLMALPYRLFAGGKIGTGKQWQSWIHIEDLVRLILFCIDRPQMSGPVNAVAPEPVSNDRFGRALGTAMRRPHWFPVPAFLLKAMLGQMSVMLLEGQRVLPAKAAEAGFEFRYPTIDVALNQLFG